MVGATSLPAVLRRVWDGLRSQECYACFLGKVSLVFRREVGDHISDNL